MSVRLPLPALSAPGRSLFARSLFARSLSALSLSAMLTAGVLPVAALAPQADAAPAAPVNPDVPLPPDAPTSPGDARAWALASALDRVLPEEFTAGPGQPTAGRAFTGNVAACRTARFTSWVETQKATWSEAERAAFRRFALLPAQEALLFGAGEDCPHFGAGRADTDVMTRTWGDLVRFWGVDDIAFFAFHGDMLLDPGRVSRVLRALTGQPASQTDALASDIVQVVDTDAFAHGRHPLLSLNAFAFRPEGPDEVPGGDTLPNRLGMGEGLFAAYRALGFGDVAPRAILAHEFGHHVQIRNGVYGPDPKQPPTTERTRRTELMADALSAYFLTHPRGGGLSPRGAAEVTSVFEATGDRRVTDPGHHGTPEQRQRAARWGADLVGSAHPRGRVLPAEAVIAAFDENLPAILRAQPRTWERGPLLTA